MCALADAAWCRRRASAPRQPRRTQSLACTLIIGRAGFACSIRTSRLLHEGAGELRNLIRRCIECEMARIENVDFGLRHVASIGLRFRKLERQIVFAPENEKARLLLAYPRLPPGVGVDIRAVIVKEIA